MSVSRTLAVAAVTALLATAACDKKPSSAPVPPTPQVGVVTLAPQKIAITTDLPGRVSAFLDAEVRARVDGIVLDRDFAEGSNVTAGQLLYQIDPAPYRAALDSAEATLQKARANLAAEQAQAARYKILVAANAVSKQDYANAISSAGQARADVASGVAGVETARINLGYTEVRAPITGRIGISQVTVGAYVQASAATLMSTIQEVDPVYVDITQSVSDLLKLRHEAAAGRIAMAGPDKVKVTLTLDDGSTYALPGQFQFSDITVDQGTGSVTLRATFPNPSLELLPGMFVHANLVEGTNEQALLVPETGITHNAKGDPTAYVVGADNKVVLRALVTSQTVGSNWVVDSGLAAGDRVIVQGTQLVQPGETVKTFDVPVPPAPDTAVTP